VVSAVRRVVDRCATAHRRGGASGFGLLDEFPPYRRGGNPAPSCHFGGSARSRRRMVVPQWIILRRFGRLGGVAGVQPHRRHVSCGDGNGMEGIEATPIVTRLVAHTLPARAWHCAVFALRGARGSPSVRLNGVMTRGRSASVGWRCLLDAAPGGAIRIAPGSSLSEQVEMQTGAEVSTEARTTIQRRFTVNGDVRIGSQCILAPNVFISSGSHPFRHVPWLPIRGRRRCACPADRRSAHMGTACGTRPRGSSAPAVHHEPVAVGFTGAVAAGPGPRRLAARSLGHGSHGKRRRAARHIGRRRRSCARHPRKSHLIRSVPRAMRGRKCSDRSLADVASHAIWRRRPHRADRRHQAETGRHWPSNASNSAGRIACEG
jgi:hypothetical protein